MFEPWEQRDGGMIVKISGYDAASKGHSWTLQRMKTDGSLEDDPRSILGDKNAYDPNGGQISTGTYVTIRWAGLDAGGVSIWYIVASAAATAVVPIGQYAGQVFMMTADNVAGWS